MFSSSALAVFVAATLALLLTPGPAVLYIIARSIDQGRLAGVVSAAGAGVGTLFHVAAAALGISAILVSSALAFTAVKYLGAAYLIYLGIRKFMEKDPTYTEIERMPQRLPVVFRQGVVVNVLNPKTALFFFAFLPQFVDRSQGAVALQILALGMIFVGLGICTDSSYAMVAGTLGGWLRSSRAFLRGERYFAGSMYIALGVVAATAGSKSK